MKILVTGGAGFIGSHLVDALVKAGHAVRVLDCLEPQVHEGRTPDYLNRRAEYLEGDVRDREALRRALSGVEVVFHEAAGVGVGQSMYQIEKYVSANTLGTGVLLDVVVNDKIPLKRLIVASSMSSSTSVNPRENAECGMRNGRVYIPNSKFPIHNSSLGV